MRQVWHCGPNARIIQSITLVGLLKAIERNVYTARLDHVRSRWSREGGQVKPALKKEMPWGKDVCFEWEIVKYMHYHLDSAKRRSAPTEAPQRRDNSRISQRNYSSKSLSHAPPVSHPNALSTFFSSRYEVALTPSSRITENTLPDVDSIVLKKILNVTGTTLENGLHRQTLKE